MRAIYVFCALTGIAGLQGDVGLRRTVSDAQTETYKVEVQEHREMSSEYFPEDMVFDTFRKGTVKLDKKASPDEAKSDVSLRYVVNQEDVDGPSDGLRTLPDPVEVKGTLDRRGLFAFDVDRATPRELMTARSISPAEMSIVVPFPEGNVKVGDSWDVIVPVKKDDLIPEPQKLTVKLVGEKKVGERAGWALAVSGTVTYVFRDFMSLELQGKKIDQTTVTKTVSDVQGDVVIDGATGRTIRAQTKLKQRQEIEFQSNISHSKMTGKYATTITVKAE